MIKFPKVVVEKRLLKKSGRNIIIGVDEVGRGPLAGPVVAGATWINAEMYDKKFSQRKLIRDSKMLSEKQRQEIVEYIKKDKNFLFGIGEVSPRMIDQMNVLKATLLAMRLAVEELVNKLKVNTQLSTNHTYLLIDGNKSIPQVKYQQKLFPKGDQKVFSIAVASIYAKVYRDELMQQYHKTYPQYGFNQHKGYGTSLHLANIKKYGACPIHRKSFGLLKNM